MYSELFLTLRNLPCPYPVEQQWLLGEENQSKMLKNLHLFKRKTANDSVMHIGTIMILGGILEGVLPIDNRKNVDCVTSHARLIWG